MASAWIVGEAEARHQHRLGVVLGADDPDHLVDVEVGDQVAVEDVEAGEDLVVAELQPLAHGLDAEAAATR